MEIDNDRTKRYEINPSRRAKKATAKSSYRGTQSRGSKSSNAAQKNKNGGKKQKKHPKLRMFIKIFIIICILLVLAGIGVFAAIFFSDKWDMTQEDLVIKMQNSTTYDVNGEALHELSGEENRKIIPLSEMGDYIPKAFVAIEDERFYKHKGIDLYRTAGAIFTYVTHGGKSSFGGSTITQQLVKNLMDDDDDSIARKIREWSRAYKVEKMLSKSQILELYLNEIFMGDTVYGVESGARYYFNKSAKDLSLAQAAFLAGINDSPNYYNPFGEEDKTEIIKNKTKLVLGKMLEVKDENGNTFINQEQYDKAVAEVDKGLKFKKGNFSNSSDLSFLEVEAIKEVVQDMMDKYDLDQKAAEARVYNNGYKIYTTEDPDIQKRMEKEYLKDEYIHDATNPDAEKGAHSQSGMVIIDYKTGHVVGCVGGLGEDSETYELDRATSQRQPGSSMKPLAAVAPALENKVITEATVYDDSPTKFGGDPFNNSTGYQGLVTVKKAIEVSSNVVNMKIISNVGPSTAVEFLNEIGMPQFNEQDAGLTLALGGSTHGASPLQMAAGYAMIANKGEYIEPTFYTKVEDNNGNVILESEQETKRVMSEGNAYVLTDILTAPVVGSDGTATTCKMSGMDVAAKTGTTTEYKDRWLCGFTPYYAAATWYGYDTPETINGWGNPAMNIWSAIMDDIHEDLPGEKFEKPDNIVEKKVCTDSGKLATSSCTHTATAVFVEGTVPDKCDGHKTVTVCAETGKLATEYCPETKKVTYLSTPEKEIDPSWSTSAGNKYREITQKCTKHTEKTMAIKVVNVVGMTEANAKSALEGLQISVVYESDSSKEDGVVLKQSVNGGKTLVKGDKITITVNKIVETEPEEPAEDPETEPEEPAEDPETEPEEPTTPDTPTTRESRAENN